MAAQDLILKVDPASFKQTVTTLEGYVNTLQNLKAQYEEKRSEISSIWTDDTAEEFQNLISTEIEKVSTAISGLQQQIQEINKLIENHEYTVSSISQEVQTAMKQAQNLFI